jgi:hypothetical protein
MTSVRLTKLTYTSVHPKILQRQSVPLVRQVFHDKPTAAFLALKGRVDHEEGTVRFINLVNTWFKMMNVKDRYSAIKHRDDSRSPRQLQCDSFQKLSNMCDVIATFTADAFVATTKFNIAAAETLLYDHHFQYVLPAAFGQDPLEKFFGNAGNAVEEIFTSISRMLWPLPKFSAYTNWRSFI